MMIKYKKHLILFTVFLTGIILFFIFTNPNHLTIGLLTIPILLIFGVVYNFCYISATYFKQLNNKNYNVRNLSAMAALTVSLIVLFKSSGGIVLADIILISLLLFISYVYISRL